MSDLDKGLFPWLVGSLVYGTPKEMTQADIDDVVTRFAEAAELSMEFLSPLSNERTDAYGGSLLARAKIIIDTVKAVRKTVPVGTCVGIKVNSTDHTDLDNFIIQFKAIVDDGVDFVEVSGGSIEDPMFSTGLYTTAKASTKSREAFFIYFANAIRSEFPDVPIMLTGGFRIRQAFLATKEQFQRYLEEMATMQDNTIIIVGAGCIGLCTAYQLSKSFEEYERKPYIMVVEASDRPFAAASSACTGCFHYHFPGPLNKVLTPLGKYSFDLWAQEAQHADFRLATGYRAKSSYGIHQGDGKGLNQLPNWIKRKISWDVDNHVLGDNTAIVTAFVSFEPLIGEKLELAGRNDGTIWVCGRRNFDATLPPPSHSDEPDEILIQEMSEHVRQWLNWGSTCDEQHGDEVRLLEKGRAFRPATKSGLPVISGVKPSDISPTTASQTTGIFLCWGHGSWGLTLGMGSGRVMSQLMCGEKPDIELDHFSLAQDTTSGLSPT
ncbi:hypothetical protein FGADI_5751 [Fusarium gaditjirri]|uniref:FAD dependent oxidoreductase domain-containing protein n=1 Tax=Fusarium gaditjirri TaxID=282569 RepID=A0A8H4T9E2_9HYPO|nr:hypothetical protein FGADI_5751 [Fusarium gaditjirri]